MASFSTRYECAVCRASCGATVHDLPDPRELIGPRSLHTLQSLDEARVLLGEAPGHDSVKETVDAVLEQSARSVLLYATCPRCGAKDPMSLVDARRTQRTVLLVTAPLYLGLAAGAWFVPWIGLYPLAGLVVLGVKALRSQEGRIPARALALTLLLNAAIVATVVLAPRFAWIAALVPAVDLVRSSRSKNEGPWQDAAARIQFDVE